MPNDVSDFWSNQNQVLENKSAQLAQQLGNLVAPENHATTAAGAAATKLGDSQRALDGIRAKLAKLDMPADGDPLLIAMNETVIALQQARLDRIAADDTLALLRQNKAALLAEKREIDDGIVLAANRLRSAQSAKSQRDSLKSKLSTTPVKDIPAAADALAKSQTAKDAVKHVEADFPAELLVQARARRTQALERKARAAATRDRAQQADDTQNEASNRSADKMPRLERALQAADAAAYDYVQRSPDMLLTAKTVLERYAARTTSNLTAAQTAHLFDPVTLATRKAALGKQAKRDAKAEELAEAQADLERAVLGEKAKDADFDEAAAKADPGKLKPKQDVVDTKSAELALLDAAYDDDAQKIVADWFAQVPDTIWEDLAAVDGAMAMLATLTPATKANDLKAALETAEATLVAELQKLEKENRTVALRRLRLAQAASLADAELATADVRAAAAVRGGI